MLANGKLIAHHWRTHAAIHTDGIVQSVAGKAHRICRHVCHWVLHVAVMSLARRWTLIFHGAEFVLFGFEIIIRVRNFPIWPGFMCATMSERIRLATVRMEIDKAVSGLTGQGCQNVRKPCYSVGRHRVAPVCESARVVSDAPSA